MHLRKEGKRLGYRAKRSSHLQPSKSSRSRLSTYNTANPNAPATIAAYPPPISPLLPAAAPQTAKNYSSRSPRSRSSSRSHSHSHSHLPPDSERPPQQRKSAAIGIPSPAAFTKLCKSNPILPDTAAAREAGAAKAAGCWKRSCT